MRATLGVLAATGLLVLAGEGILLALGIVRRSVRDMLAAAGLAYLVGIAAVMPIGIAALAAGSSFGVAAFVAVCALLGLGGAWARGTGAPGNWSGHRADAPGPSERKGLIVLAVLCACYVLVLVAVSVGQPLDDWDAWSIWSRKAIILTELGGLSSEFFTADAYAFMHQDYPLLLPLLESTYFRFMGSLDVEAVQVIFGLTLVAFVGALAYMARSLLSVPVLALALAVALFLPAVNGQLPTAYADVPLGFFLALGALALGRWLGSGARPELALGALLLVAAASLKNEGLLAAVLAFSAALAVLLWERRWRQVRHLALAGAGVVVAILPWRLWTAAHDVSSDLPISKGLDPGFLADRAGRLWPATEELAWQLLRQGGWLVPAVIALAAVVLVFRGQRRLPLFYLLLVLGTFASVVWAFVIAPNTLEYQIRTAAGRVVVGTVFVSVAALVHLSGVLGRTDWPPRPAAADDTTRDT
jgi:hypothetical protein